jgi:hypothetical protein
MPVLMGVFQPSVNQILPCPKIQPGEWLIHTGKGHVPCSRSDFGEYGTFCSGRMELISGKNNRA